MLCPCLILGRVSSAGVGAVTPASAFLYLNVLASKSQLSDARFLRDIARSDVSRLLAIEAASIRWNRNSTPATTIAANCVIERAAVSRRVVLACMRSLEALDTTSIPARTNHVDDRTNQRTDQTER